MRAGNAAPMVSMRALKLLRSDPIVRWKTYTLTIVTFSGTMMRSNVVRTGTATVAEGTGKGVDALGAETLDLVGRRLNPGFRGLDSGGEFSGEAAEDGSAFGSMSIKFGCYGSDGMDHKLIKHGVSRKQL